MSVHRTVETVETGGCSIDVCRIDGPQSRELFFHCRPPAAIADAGRQAEALYRAILTMTEGVGGGLCSVVAETLFLRDLRSDVESVRAARRRVLAAGAATRESAATVIEQPPLNADARVEVLAQAVMPTSPSAHRDSIVARRETGTGESAQARGLRLRLGNETHLHAGDIRVAGSNAYEQALGMFLLAEDLLRAAGMTFGDVVRTWIYLRDIDRDYDDLNRARRTFFETRGIDPVPASTGIGAGPASAAHDLCMSIHAARAGDALPRTVMTSPTLNEATDYGADFVRGMRVREGGLDRLFVSGTASIDEYGRTAHPGDIDAQADRMLVNVAALLERQGAAFGDVVSAVTYLKHPADADRLRKKLRDAGFAGFPHALVVAPICRADLLCETEALAIIEAGKRSGSDLRRPVTEAVTGDSA